MGDNRGIYYWDASAILSVLFMDSHSTSARKKAEEKSEHLVSSLAYAEVCSVISRINRENVIPSTQINSAYETLDQGSWRRIEIVPDWNICQEVSKRWSLRGADLWHLATAKSLQPDFPELILLTYDSQLQTAADGEKLSGNSVD